LFELRLRHHRVERWLGIRAFPAIAGPYAVTPVHFFDSSLIRHAFFERECSLRSVRRRLRMEERQSRSYRDQDEVSCRCAKKETNQGAQVKEGISGNRFLLHCKWVMRGAPRSWMPDRCQCFSFISGFFCLSCSESHAGVNEIGYAGDTSAATVTGIADPGYHAHL